MKMIYRGSVTNMEDNKIDIKAICVVGLGYVGLPLLAALSKHFKCYGYDVDREKIEALRNRMDYTGELNQKELSTLQTVNLGYHLKKFRLATVYIVTVPTPVDLNKVPDLAHLSGATKSIAEQLKKGDLVIYESTVFPGATEEICIPILENISGLKLNQDFSVGYSPERINPGDKINKMEQITKIISATNDRALNSMKAIYGSIIKAGLHVAPNLKVAEAAKVVENIQRDLNIALMNELSQVFATLEINTKDVIAAASTKWNFMPVYPGLVGGHCIGVDPYYLISRSAQEGLIPHLILRAREINESMTGHVVNAISEIALLRSKSIERILILGVTFKPNVPDVRNSKVLEIITRLEKLGRVVDVYDPYVETSSNFPKGSQLNYSSYDLVIVAVPHTLFERERERLLDYDANGGIVIDLYGKIVPEITAFEL